VGVSFDDPLVFTNGYAGSTAHPSPAPKGLNNRDTTKINPIMALCFLCISVVMPCLLKKGFCQRASVNNVHGLMRDAKIKDLTPILMTPILLRDAKIKDLTPMFRDAKIKDLTPILRAADQPFSEFESFLH
jgi:hypothetical protein